MENHWKIKPLRSFVCSLAHSLAPELKRKSLSTHSALLPLKSSLLSLNKSEYNRTRLGPLHLACHIKVCWIEVNYH